MSRPVKAGVGIKRAAGEADMPDTLYSVRLIRAGNRMIELLKELRSITGLGLKDARAMAERTPSVVVMRLSVLDAYRIQKRLERVGAKADLFVQSSD